MAADRAVGDQAAVEARWTAGDLERMRKAIAALDEAMDDHLSFARKSTLREYAESIGVAVAVALLLRAFVVEAFQIPSGSMIPTLEVGDHIFVSKFSYGLSIPFTDTKILQYASPSAATSSSSSSRTITAPTTSSAWSACRATPSRCGSEAALHQRPRGAAASAMPRACRYNEASHATAAADDHDCELLGRDAGQQGPRDDPRAVAAAASDFPRTVIAAGQVFVMGDNRDNSSDSRVWGTVDMDLIKGRR